MGTDRAPPIVGTPTIGTPTIAAPAQATPPISTATTAPPRAPPKSALPFFLLLLVSLLALAFDLTLPSRLPSSGDYAEAAAHLRGHAQPGDAVQIWPVWLEEARLHVDVGPVLAEEDLAHADFPGASRLWLLALPGAPHAGVSAAEDSLRARGATTMGDAVRFGPLALGLWDLHAPPLAADLLFGSGPREWHEVQYVSRACRVMQVGGERDPARLTLSGAAGSTLHLRAGVIGEQAYKPELTQIRVEAFSPRGKLAELTLTRTRDPQPAWLAADLPSGGGDLQLELRASTPGGFRPPICVAAWTTR